MNKETKYPTGVLLESRALSRYQRDFAKALLVKPEYSVSEAKAVLEQFMKRKGVK